ncbi:hypothetical protein BZM27_46480 [Paraburkholderia steynii]|uniref:Uncharacterized protein n=1 Tax=Paraburkholderia steynii TaxID=1245441 RepID=A0A4R0X5J6_9BURK|nr:hypothetical protein BZM27_46480 [Paraburkholderia steynii]
MACAVIARRGPSGEQSNALRVIVRAERLARDEHGVASRRMHAALGATDHRLGELSGGFAIRATARVTIGARARACVGAGVAARTCARRCARCVGAAQCLHQPLANDEQ